ncbi:MAG: DNA repair protein RadC [Bacteroidetes bacterium]|nr:DNA repair protein RadC [Bacteroidota bacterium]
MLKVKDLPLQDRPREKLVMRGVNSLSDTELIAILLRTGQKGKSVICLAQDLMVQFGNLSNIATQSLDSLVKIPGIGKDKAATLIAALELSRRIGSQKRSILDTKITSPGEVAQYFIPLLRDEIKEKFIVVCLSSSNKIIKHETISVGNLNTSVVHPREVFKVAIENNSANIILLHNHPSGNPEPSNEDIKITKQLVEAGKIIDIQVFDHIIIAADSYTSFVDRKIL